MRCEILLFGEQDTDRYPTDPKRYNKILTDIGDIRYANPEGIGGRYRYVKIFQIQISPDQRGSADHYA